MPQVFISYYVLPLLVFTFLAFVFCAYKEFSRLPGSSVDPTPSINLDLPESSIIDDTINNLRLLLGCLRDEQRHSVEPAFYDPRVVALAGAIDELEAMRQP